MMSCRPPGFIENTDDAVWDVERGRIVVWRMDGRKLSVPLEEGSCAACTAELLFLESCEMRKYQ
jgi:hypothetical protein